MPSFNLLNIFCCRKSRWDGSGGPEPATQDKTALHPVPALDPPLEEQQEQHETKGQNTAMGLSNMAWAVPEYRSSFESDSTASQHVDSDSDSLNSDIDLPRSTKPSTAFGAVRNRFIRSISHNNSSDHPSRVSVSNSEEEVARRAELRRIMRLRIQDQLESDEAEDQSENKLTVSIRRVASSADSALPISGPRDAIKFGVNNSSSSNGQPARLDRERGNHGTSQDFGGSHGSATAPERDSSEESDTAGRNDDSSENAVIQRPLPIHPSAHISLTDVELSPSQKSFQLSNGSGRLDRILGPESSFNNRQASSGDGQSALGVWLIAQGLRSRDNSTFSIDGEEEKEEAQTRKSNKKATDNTPAVSREKNSLVHGTHAMSEKGDCHEQVSTFTSSPKKLDPQCLLEPGTPKDFRDNSAFSGELPWGPTYEAETMHGATSAAQSDSAIFVQREAELKTIRRRFSEALDQKSTEKTVSTRFREDFSHFDTRSPAKKPSRNNTCLAIPASHFRAKSEGALYQYGEDRQDVSRAQRFPLVPAEKTKIHEKEASDRSKRRSNMSIRPYMSRLPTEEYRKPSLERQESATDLWQRAIRLEAESRHSSSFLNTPNYDQRSLSSNRSLKRTGAARNSNNNLSEVRREISQLTPSTDERSSPNNSKWLIERWVSQMRPRPAHPTESVSSAGLVDPPRSWSKFPSFNREERNRNITSKDKVHPRDFAVKHVTSEGQIRWATDTGSGRDGQRAHKLPRSLSTRFGRLVKYKMSRMMPSKGLRHRVSQAFIARSMTPSPPHMEYPEMGIRPSDSGYTEIQAMGREINYMKGRAHLQTLEKDLSKPRSSRSLGDRVVALMHETIGQRHPKHDGPLQSPDIPMIPVTPSLFRQSIAATATDVFVTPKSRLSNDDESDEEKGETGRDSTKVRKQETCSMIFENDRASSTPVYAVYATKLGDGTHSLSGNMNTSRLGATQDE
ncbi:hypothetical protein ACHAP8_005187 [Fusarium lateritium]